MEQWERAVTEQTRFTDTHKRWQIQFQGDSISYFRYNICTEHHVQAVTYIWNISLFVR